MTSSAGVPALFTITAPPGPAGGNYRLIIELEKSYVTLEDRQYYQNIVFYVRVFRVRVALQEDGMIPLNPCAK